MTSKKSILEIYKSDWQEAIADGAYAILTKTKNNIFLDKHEEVRTNFRFEELISTLSNFDGDKLWEDRLNNLAYLTSIAYVTERATGQSLEFGGFMTLIGHARHRFIEWGFLGYLAHSIDFGLTKKLFEEYLVLDNDFHKAVHRGDNKTSMNLREPWRLSMVAVDNAYESLYSMLTTND